MEASDPDAVRLKAGPLGNPVAAEKYGCPELYSGQVSISIATGTQEIAGRKPFPVSAQMPMAT